MVTVLRAQGFRIVIFLNDHEPAQVHVFGDGEAKINLIGEHGLPELVWTVGMTRSEVRRALGIVVENHHMLQKRWNEIHG